jgi:hypothetical protein
LRVDQLNPIAHGVMSTRGAPEVEQHRPGLVQQGEDPSGPIGRDQVRVGHAAPQQRVSLAEVVVDIQSRTTRRVSRTLARRLEELAMVSRKASVRSCPGGGAATCAIDMRRNAGSDRVRSAW